MEPRRHHRDLKQIVDDIENGLGRHEQVCSYLLAEERGLPEVLETLETTGERAGELAERQDLRPRFNEPSLFDLLSEAEREKGA